MAYATTITDVLNAWDKLGVFAYLLPFLVIFAVVFGILNKTRVLGSNRGVQAVIALSVGLLSLQFDYVSNFFADIFPLAGIGVAVLLVALILMGLISDEKWAKYVWFVIGILLFIWVLLTAISNIGWLGGKGYQVAESWPLILILIIFGLAVLWMFLSAKKSDEGEDKEKKPV